MKPYIQLITDPINFQSVANDEMDKPLYHVIVSEGKLKMKFLVTISEELNNRGFAIIRAEALTLTGQDENKIYLEKTMLSNKIASDHTIVNELFHDTLNNYGIELLKINFHNYEYFEASAENYGFIFTDPEKHEKLKSLINKKCIKMMSIIK